MITISEIKWIKIATDIFDDEKILLIESLPDSDAIIICWFKLLCLAGKQNNSGVFLINDRIPYTDKMLATIFRRKESTVQMALQTFEQFGMIEIINGTIAIPNWGKHQSVERIEKLREYQRDYHKEYRAKQKALAAGSDNSDCKRDSKVSSKVYVNGLEEDKKKEKKKDKNDIKHLHGECNNVLITDDEFQKLQESFPDYQSRIDNLSRYLKQTGKHYASHYQTILNWARRDAEKKQKSSNPFLDALGDMP